MPIYGNLMYNKLPNLDYIIEEGNRFYQIFESINILDENNILTENSVGEFIKDKIKKFIEWLKKVKDTIVSLIKKLKDKIDSYIYKHKVSKVRLEINSVINTVHYVSEIEKVISSVENVFGKVKSSLKEGVKANEEEIRQDEEELNKTIEFSESLIDEMRNNPKRKSVPQLRIGKLLEDYKKGIEAYSTNQKTLDTSIRNMQAIIDEGRLDEEIPKEYRNTFPILIKAMTLESNLMLEMCKMLGNEIQAGTRMINIVLGKNKENNT